MKIIVRTRNAEFAGFPNPNKETAEIFCSSPDSHSLPNSTDAVRSGSVAAGGSDTLRQVDEPVPARRERLSEDQGPRSSDRPSVSAHRPGRDPGPGPSSGQRLAPVDYAAVRSHSAPCAGQRDRGGRQAVLAHSSPPADQRTSSRSPATQGAGSSARHSGRSNLPEGPSPRQSSTAAKTQGGIRQKLPGNAQARFFRGRALRHQPRTRGSRR